MLKRLLYIKYLIQWYINHSSKAFKGCEPACYQEWLNNEYKEES